MARRSTQWRFIEQLVSVRQWVMRKEEKVGFREHFNKDMTCDGMTFKAHKQIVKPLSQTCVHIFRASVRSEKKCACMYGEVFSARSLAVGTLPHNQLRFSTGATLVHAPEPSHFRKQSHNKSEVSSITSDGDHAETKNHRGLASSQHVAP